MCIYSNNIPQGEKEMSKEIRKTAKQLRKRPYLLMLGGTLLFFLLGLFLISQLGFPLGITQTEVAVGDGRTFLKIIYPVPLKKEGLYNYYDLSYDRVEIHFNAYTRDGTPIATFQVRETINWDDKTTEQNFYYYPDPLTDNVTLIHTLKYTKPGYFIFELSAESEHHLQTIKVPLFIYMSDTGEPPTTTTTTTTTTEITETSETTATAEVVAAPEYPVSSINGVFIISILVTLVIIKRVKK